MELIPRSTSGVIEFTHWSTTDAIELIHWSTSGAMPIWKVYSYAFRPPRGSCTMPLVLLPLDIITLSGNSVNHVQKFHSRQQPKPASTTYLFMYLFFIHDNLFCATGCYEPWTLSKASVQKVIQLPAFNGFDLFLFKPISFCKGSTIGLNQTTECEQSNIIEEDLVAFYKKKDKNHVL